MTQRDFCGVVGGGLGAKKCSASGDGGGPLAVMVEKTGARSFPGLWKAATRDAEGTETFIHQTRLYPVNL